MVCSASPSPPRILRESDQWRLLCANCGDSRAVLCRNRKALALSKDHKPHDPEEHNQGVKRAQNVADHFLYKVKRDLPEDQQKVISVPEVEEVLLTDVDRFLVMASDGVFEIFSSDELIEELQKEHEVSAVLHGPLVANPADLGDDDDEEEEEECSACGPTEWVQDSHHASSMRPTSFLPNTQAQGDDQDPYADDAEEVQTSEHGHPDRAAEQPWRAFFFNTVLLCVMWWCASFVAFYDVYIDLPEFTKGRYGLKPGEVAHMATLVGEKLETGWSDLNWQPHGFACDGKVFAVAGRDASELKNGALQFEAAPRCVALQDKTIQDSFFDNSGSVVVMPLKGQELISCPLSEKNVSTSLLARPLAREWLEEIGGTGPLPEPVDTKDRGGAPLEEHQGLKHLLHPEEISALSMAPCPLFDGAPVEEDCLVVGTTARRLVQLSRGKQLASDKETWLPRRLLRRSGESLGPGAFTAIGKRLLVVLEKEATCRYSESLSSIGESGANSVSVLDLFAGGRSVARWTLPRPEEKEDAGYSGLCASHEHLFALQAGPTPTVWRFPHTLGRV
eukprot:g19201.t1